MKSVVSFCLLLMCFVNLSAQELTQEEINKALNRSKELRKERNEKFKDLDKSPLVKDSIPSFSGLNYFDLDPEYIFKATFIKIDNGREFEMLTNTQRKPLYVDYALISFVKDGIRHTFHAYRNVELGKPSKNKSELFIPFNDYTNGLTSYGGGRYLDITEPKGNLLILNFNDSYNPYCSYNPNYSCPIPPEENKLELSLPAGESKYH